MKVEHDPVRNRFFVQIENEEAYLSYTRRDDVMDLTYVFVPPRFRGQAHARRIIIAACNFARSEGCRIIPTCPYIAHSFLPRFPEYQDLVLR
jgi:uncharacterized protein